MKVKKFYRTQREVASVINEIIDEYWHNDLSDDQLENDIKEIYKNNKEKIIKNDDFTTVLKQQCGKNRLTIVTKLINY